MMVNGVRGEAVAMLAGAERRLCLTLGALAEIETGLGVAGMAALARSPFVEVRAAEQVASRIVDRT